MKLTKGDVKRNKLKKATIQTERKKSVRVQTRNGKQVVPVFISIDNPGFVPQDGFVLRNTSPDGSILSGYIELDKITKIAQQTNVRKIEAARHRKMNLKSGLQSIKADLVHQGLENLPQAYQGEDVIVGVFDSGLDVRNPDFFDGDNGSRVLFLKEYYEKETQNGTEVGSYEWTKEDIDSNISSVTQIDGFGSGGHGTHVTGIAAGGGITNSDFKGVAPKANIIFVKGDRDPNGEGGFEDDDIIDGISYIFTKAEELGKPAVVNLSLGGLYGPRDGTSLFEQYITQLHGEGRIIIAAAGNEGFDYLHSGKTMESGKTYATVEVPWDDISFDKEIWYDKGGISQYRVIALNPENDSQVAASPWFSVGTDNWETEEGYRLVDSGEGFPAGFIYHESIELENTENGDGMIYIYVYDGYESEDDEDYAYVNDYYWAIPFQSSTRAGRMDGTNFYASSSPFNTVISATEFIPGDLTQSVGSPATAFGVISVGAYVTTNTWTNDDGSTMDNMYPRDFYYEEESKAELGELAYFSSRGPTRDNRFVPQITAPGDLIFSVRSHDIDDSDLETDYLIESGNYYGMGGTSMATPFVTGTVALMLQINPNLDSETIKEIFAETAVRDSFTGEEESLTWGYGKLNTLEAVKLTLAYETTLEQAKEYNQFELYQNYPNPFNPSTEIMFSLPSSARVSLDVFDLLGRNMLKVTSNKNMSAGINTLNLNGENLSSGLYFYRLKAEMSNGHTIQKVKSMTLIK